MRHSYRCHVASEAVELAVPERNGGRNPRIDAGDLLDTARCPCCRAPLVARMGRAGPYFHCRCCERGGRFAADARSILHERKGEQRR
jgi:hypothetical protein